VFGNRSGYGNQGARGRGCGRGPEALAQFEALDQHFAVGAQLLRRRRELHLSQQVVAERSGVPQAEISRIERGVSNPTIATLAHLLKALGNGRVWLDWGSAKPA
jgi:DNA-binding XRE family transcriptional regulator